MASTSNISKSVLFVDDNDSYRQMICEVLESEGHTVVQAEDGKSALLQFRSDVAFDVAILDLHMPDMNGIELAKVIRRQLSIPILLCTADESAESLIEGIVNIKVVDKTLEGTRAMLKELQSEWIDEGILGDEL